MLCGVVLVLAGCTSAAGDGAVVTEMVYVDADGNSITPPTENGGGARPEPGGEVPQATASAPTATTARPVSMQRFTTPDGQTFCSSEPRISGIYGDYDGRPGFVCVNGDTSIPRPNMSRCSQGVNQLGGAAAIGPGWVATGVCSGGWVFNGSTDSYPAATVGQVVQSGPVTCTIEAVDAVSCAQGADGFRLSASAVSAWGNDVTSN